MERINLNYSLKNIPTPNKTVYEMKLIEKVEAVIKRMRWKLFWHLNKTENEDNEASTTYGFKK